MSYRQLQGRLQNYQQAIPEYLQQFFGEYSADPYQGAVLDEYERRNADTFGQNLGQMASYFGGAGRMGGGMMGRSMSDATAENQQRLRGDIGGLLSGDYNNFMQRQMEAAGLRVTVLTRLPLHRELLQEWLCRPACTALTHREPLAWAIST
jgi:hypothetical protein